MVFSCYVAYYYHFIIRDDYITTTDHINIRAMPFSEKLTFLFIATIVYNQVVDSLQRKLKKINGLVVVLMLVVAHYRSTQHFWGDI
jgi:uncharacterized membrane protein